MADKTQCEQLAAAIGAGDSKTVPAIFEVLTNEDEARLLLALAPPASVQEASERTGLSAQAVEAMIDPLFRKGLLFKRDFGSYYLDRFPRMTCVDYGFLWQREFHIFDNLNWYLLKK